MSHFLLILASAYVSHHPIQLSSQVVPASNNIITMFAAHSTIAGNNVPGRVSSHLRYRELSGGFSHFPLLAIIFIIIIIIIIVIIIIINTILKKIVANS